MLLLLFTDGGGSEVEELDEDVDEVEVGGLVGSELDTDPPDEPLDDEMLLVESQTMLELLKELRPSTRVMTTLEASLKTGSLA